MDEEIVRVCGRCLQERRITSFYPHPKGKNGRRGHCGWCASAETKANNAKNRTPHREANKRYNEKIKNLPPEELRRRQLLAAEAQRRRRATGHEKERQKLWVLKNKDKSRKFQRQQHLKEHYQLSLVDFDNLLKAQTGKCAICQRDIFHRGDRVASDTACVDHDHKTGRVRGLLCTNCNGGIGRLKDSEEIILSALAYIRKHATQE